MSSYFFINSNPQCLSASVCVCLPQAVCRSPNPSYFILSLFLSPLYLSYPVFLASAFYVSLFRFSVCLSISLRTCKFQRRASISSSPETFWQKIRQHVMTDPLLSPLISHSPSL